MIDRLRTIAPTKHRSAASRRREMFQIAFLAGLLGVVLHAIGFFVFRITPPEARTPVNGQKPAQVIWSHPMPASPESIESWEEWLALLNPKSLYFGHSVAPESPSTTTSFNIIDLFPTFHRAPSPEQADFAFQPELLPEQRPIQPEVARSSHHEALLREFGRTKGMLPHSDFPPPSFQVFHLDTGDEIAAGELSIGGDSIPGILWDPLSFNMTVVAEIPSLPFFKINSSGDGEFDQVAMDAFREHPRFKSLPPGSYRVVISP